MAAEKKDARTVEEALTREHLALFRETLAEFHDKFCALMFSQKEFNIRVELRGTKGGLTHCRIYEDGTKRPKNSKIEEFENDD